MKRLLLGLTVLVLAVPARAVTIQVIPEDNSVQITLGNFKTETAVDVKPETVGISIDTTPPGSGSANLWSGSFTDTDITGSSTYSLVTTVPYASWRLPVAMRRQPIITVRVTFWWTWHAPGGADRQGVDWADVQISRRDHPATPTP